ncbi:DUF4112 domain-containing protein [Nodularia harveyana UHCC-0300]|uniref:DUF4112 domain-containing protein n=1 Tax=Nodularia harveyana UHCC-0300 TaxID=2974287 RepID=A0ABU5U9Y8_9CYAN|nr:DUF4112 domain-containing protein [Nodularia harveyana]MEA5580346.1 DUF4112 domain-containing protein [Nodularia harveyana UHCC-0300]
MPNSYIDADTQALTLKRLRQLSRILDKAITIPGTPINIGLDPLMGLLPIGGDVLGIILSSYIVTEAARLGVPKSTLSRMILNVIIDGLIGTVPVIGDLFDFAWTANDYNIKLLEAHLQLPLNRKL